MNAHGWISLQELSWLEAASRTLLAVTAVWLATALALSLWRSASSATRHRVWSLSIVAALAVPVAIGLLPARRVGVWDAPPIVTESTGANLAGFNASATAESRFEAITTASTRQDAADERGELPAASGAPMEQPSDARTPRGSAEFAARSAMSPTASDAQPAALQGLPAAHPRAGTLGAAELVPVSSGGASIVWWGAVLAWSIPALWILARLAWSLCAVASLVRSSIAVTEGLASQTLQRLCDRYGRRTVPRLFECANAWSPLCVGVFRPTIVLPESARDWSAAAMESALAHELAHVVRRDVAWQLAARWVCALYWFHPLAWLAAWRMRVERETACDDWVLLTGHASADYAQTLLQLATNEARRSRARDLAASVQMVSRRGFEQRIDSILQPHRNRSPVTRRMGGMLAVVTVSMLLAAGFVSPFAPAEHVAAEDPATKTTPDDVAGTSGGSDAASAGQAEAEPAGEDDTVATITGRVVDESGNPVKGARVWYKRHTFFEETLSADDGRFTLRFSDARALYGHYVLAADGTRMGAHVLPYRLANEPQLTELEVELELRSPREIVARIVDDRKQPVAGALVVATSSFETIAEDSSAADGSVILKVPVQLPLDYVYAVQAGVGLDYFAYRRPGEPASNPYKLPADHDEPIELVLNGTRTVRVVVTDDAGRPLPHVNVAPWYFDKPKKGSDLNVASDDWKRRVTDADGVAEFSIVPVDNTGRINFWVRREGYFAPKRFLFDPADPVDELQAVLIPQVMLRGRVWGADGEPAAGADVTIRGEGHTFDGFRGQATTNAEGRFELLVDSDKYYHFVATKDRFVSPSHLQTIRKGEPVEDVELRLQPATRVFGRVTIGTDQNKQPQPQKSVQLYLKAGRSYYELPDDQRLPNPNDSNDAVSPYIVRQATSDDQGRFEFFVGPGDYYIIGPDNAERPKFMITGESEYEVNLHAELPETIPMSGRVVLKNEPHVGVAEVRVFGRPVNNGSRLLDAVTDAEGRFVAERASGVMYVDVLAKDRGLRALVKLEPGEDQATIPVAPTTRVSGVLLDATNGLPIAGRKIDFGVRFDLHDGSFAYFGGGSATTGEDGTFTLDHLVPGWDYVVSVATSTAADGSPRSWRKLTTLKTRPGDHLQLGDVELPAGSTPLTLEARVRRAFHFEGTLTDRFEQRLRDARLNFQRVIVLLGSPGGKLTQQFYEQYYARRQRELYVGMQDYLLLPVDVADMQRLSELGEWLTRRGLSKPAGRKDALQLYVFDEQGGLLAQAADEDLMEGQSLSPERILAFTEDTRPRHADAEALFAAALARAKSENKRVLVQHSGAHCGPCVLLSRYLDAHEALISKDYVYVKLDSRMARGQEVIDKVRTEDGGIPWMVILDAQGAPLVTSTGESGNIGYPSSKAGIAHFESMLRRTAQRLSDAEIEKLMEALQTE